MSDPRLADMGDGITRVDTNYIRGDATACYIFASGNEAAVIDTGAVNGPPAVAAGLGALGLTAEQVKYVMPTHVHLDHAGAAGTLMQMFPDAELLVHPRGARHLIDPTKLAAGARKVYGDAKFDEYYGELVPVPSDRVREVADGAKVLVGQRLLTCLHTLGHAKHHYCVFEQTSRTIFTGDTFGVSFREFDVGERSFVFPATAPVDFDPDAWLASIERLAQLQPSRVLLTHFGSVNNVRAGAQQLSAGLVRFKDIALANVNSADVHQSIKVALTEYLLAQLEAYGSPLSEAEALRIMEVDLEVNTQGLVVWLQRTQPRA